jgi:DNA polymerase elongation subunit (family B)
MAKKLEKSFPNEPIFGRIQYIITSHMKMLDGLPVVDGKIIGRPDYEYYWDVQIKPPIDRIMIGVFGRTVDARANLFDLYHNF